MKDWCTIGMYLALFAVVVVAVGCDGDSGSSPSGVFVLTSSAFDNGSSIPVQYTCDGSNVSPPLMWSDAPEGTQSLALIVDDPDAPGGNWVHWVVSDIPSSASSFPQELKLRIKLPALKATRSPV